MLHFSLSLRSCRIRRPAGWWSCCLQNSRWPPSSTSESGHPWSVGFSAGKCKWSYKLKHCSNRTILWSVDYNIGMMTFRTCMRQSCPSGLMTEVAGMMLPPAPSSSSAAPPETKKAPGGDTSSGQHEAGQRTRVCGGQEKRVSVFHFYSTYIPVNMAASRRCRLCFLVLHIRVRVLPRPS